SPWRRHGALMRRLWMTAFRSSVGLLLQVPVTTSWPRAAIRAALPGRPHDIRAECDVLVQPQFSPVVRLGPTTDGVTAAWPSFGESRLRRASGERRRRRLPAAPCAWRR